MSASVKGNRNSVLIVDSEPVVCSSVKHILAANDFDADEAYNAKAALDLMRKKAYDVVLTDMMLPGYDDLEFLRTIKQSWPHVNVVLMARYPGMKTAVKSIKLGAFDFIPMPFTAEELTGVTFRAVKRKELIGEKGEGDSEAVLKRSCKKKRCYRLMNHSWVSMEDDEILKIGLDEDYLKTTGEIVNCDLPFEGDDVEQGRVCACLTGKDLKIHKVWSPVSGKVVEANRELIRNPSLANEEIKDELWLIRVMPTNLLEDLESLVCEADER